MTVIAYMYRAYTVILLALLSVSHALLSVSAKMAVPPRANIAAVEALGGPLATEMLEHVGEVQVLEGVA